MCITVWFKLFHTDDGQNLPLIIAIFNFQFYGCLYLAPLLLSGEIPSEVLHPARASTVQEKHGSAGEDRNTSPMKAG